MNKGNVDKESQLESTVEERCYLVDVHRGQTEAVQLSLVCADGQGLLCWAEAHGVNLLTVSLGHLIAVWVWENLKEKQTHTHYHLETYTKLTVSMCPLRINPYLYPPALPVAVLLCLLKETNSAWTHGAHKALGIGQDGCDARNSRGLIDLSISDHPRPHLPAQFE